MLHDRTASTLSLARVILQGVDRRQDQTSVRTASLVLLLETLIDLGTPRSDDKIVDVASRTVLGVMAAANGVKGAERGA